MQEHDDAVAHIRRIRREMTREANGDIGVYLDAVRKVEKELPPDKVATEEKTSLRKVG